MYTGLCVCRFCVVSSLLLQPARVSGEPILLNRNTHTGWVRLIKSNKVFFLIRFFNFYRLSSMLIFFNNLSAVYLSMLYWHLWPVQMSSKPIPLNPCGSDFEIWLYKAVIFPPWIVQLKHSSTKLGTCCYCGHHENHTTDESSLCNHS